MHLYFRTLNIKVGRSFSKVLVYIFLAEKSHISMWSPTLFPVEILDFFSYHNKGVLHASQKSSPLFIEFCATLHGFESFD